MRRNELNVGDMVAVYAPNSHSMAYAKQCVIMDREPWKNFGYSWRPHFMPVNAGSGVALMERVHPHGWRPLVVPLSHVRESWDVYVEKRDAAEANRRRGAIVREKVRADAYASYERIAANMAERGVELPEAGYPVLMFDPRSARVSLPLHVFEALVDALDPSVRGKGSGDVVDVSDGEADAEAASPEQSIETEGRCT